MLSIKSTSSLFSETYIASRSTKKPAHQLHAPAQNRFLAIFQSVSADENSFTQIGA